ncbi:MAG: formamidopyrimidine-DNA glycosylase [Verrucomicrobiota bacterium]|jgi:formamidopyrimidine-DNA glycosylase
MPELPEVEVLALHLRPLVESQTIHTVQILRDKTCRPHTPHCLVQQLSRQKIQTLERLGKYLVFTTHNPHVPSSTSRFLVHLGMTGRLFIQPTDLPLPKHTAACLTLDRGNLVFQDTRYFGRLTLDLSPLDRLGPEPLSPNFTTNRFAQDLQTSRQPIKVRLLDQSLVAGVGNIYASEALFRARIHPARPANTLTLSETQALRNTIRTVLRQAIRFGSTVPLNFSSSPSTNGLFYYGTAPDTASYEERLLVYDREHLPCAHCQTPIQRLTQAQRSTYLCPTCQPPHSKTP